MEPRKLNHMTPDDTVKLRDLRRGKLSAKTNCLRKPHPRRACEVQWTRRELGEVSSRAVSAMDQCVEKAEEEEG